MNIKFLKKIVKIFLPKKLLNFLIKFYPIPIKIPKELQIKKGNFYFDIIDKTNRCIRIHHKHSVYLYDILNCFEYYFSAVKPLEIDGLLLVDYSTPRYHEVIDYDYHPVIFPSFAEPIITTKQYLEFANLKNGSVVLDLGAYSGLTSIIFDQHVYPDGRVISVEADVNNIKYIKKNFKLYERITNRKIDLLEGAVWKDNNGITFSSEGNMGASAVEYVGENRGNVIEVKSYTLSSIANIFNLQRGDFIKVDIEGAETVIFDDSSFFNLFKPRIIIEPHILDKGITSDICKEKLSKYGYRCKEIKQYGVHLPLLECYPDR